jgi:hypothetical protein
VSLEPKILDVGAHTILLTGSQAREGPEYPERGYD